MTKSKVQTKQHPAAEGNGYARAARVFAIHKTHENRLRCILDRRGYRLEKSRARDPHSLTYSGYQIVDIQTGGLAAGWGNADRGFALDLDEVEQWVNKP